nr:hypothetical protein [Amycolatopsis sp. RTGN1]
MSEPPGFPLRTTDFDDVLVYRSSPNATVHIGLSQPRQSEEKVPDVVAKLVEKGPAIDVIPERQPDFGVESGGDVGRHRPRQPQNGNVTFDVRGSACSLG